MKGSLTPGTFQAFFQYMNMSSEPITELSYMTNSLQSALASMERVYELLDEPEMEAEPEAPKRIGHALGAVEFSHVRFGQLLVNRHFISFIHSFFMMFQALDPRQKVVSHHLMRHDPSLFLQSSSHILLLLFPLLPVSPASLRFYLSKVLSTHY